MIVLYLGLGLLCFAAIFGFSEVVARSESQE